MFIIFGTRGITSSVAYGSFHCPQCGHGMDFKHQEVRRFFTLFFIPVIPLDKLGEYVECQSCQGTFKPAVLAYDPGAEAERWNAHYWQVMLRVMVRMMAADGRIDTKEVAVVRDIYFALTEQSISDEEVALVAAEAGGASAPITEEVQRVAALLNHRGKELVVQAAVMVAVADEIVVEEEDAFLLELGTALGMSRAHIQAVINELRMSPAKGELQAAALN